MLDPHPSHRSSRIMLGTTGLVLASIAACSAPVTSDTARVAAPVPVAGFDLLSGSVILPFTKSADSVGMARFEPPRARYMPNAAEGLRHRTTPVPMPNALTPGTGAAQRRDTSMLFFDFQVDQQVRQLSGMHISYPAEMKAAARDGQVLAQFVVDTTGGVEPGSLRVLKSTNEAFTKAVREALPTFRYTPAEIGRRKVRQLVQQPFIFAPPK